MNIEIIVSVLVALLLSRLILFIARLVITIELEIRKMNRLIENLRK
jgi:hypothetical protein